MLIDAHHHVWDLGVRHQPWLDGEGLAPLRRDFAMADYPGPAAGVTASVLVQTVIEAGETPELLALAAAGDQVAGVVGWADLTDPGIADVLAGLRARPGGGKLVAIRHQVQSEPDPRWLLRPDVLRGLRALASAGLVYDLVVTAEQLSVCAEAAAAVPELTFVLDHLGKPPVAGGSLEPWAGGLRQLAALPNTAGKLSGLVTESDWQHWQLADQRPYADIALDAFGPARLMFGSDWPVCTLAASYDEVLAAAREFTSYLSADERDAIFAGTATRLYGLRLPGAHIFRRDGGLHRAPLGHSRASRSFKGWPGYEMGAAAAPRPAD